jgi:hypothetical protein
MKSLSIIKTLMAIFAISFVFSLSGCQKDNSGVNPEVNIDETATATEYSIPMPEEPATTVEDATLENDMQCYSLFNGNKDYWKKYVKHIAFERIMKQLNLTDEQKTQIKQFIQSHKDCMEAALEDLRTALQPILETAKTQRQAIVNNYKNGTIDKKEALKELSDLNKQTRLNIKNDANVQAAITKIQDCRKALFDNIKSILTDTQKTKFETWLIKLHAWYHWKR